MTMFLFTQSWLARRLTPRRDEKGAILIMAAFGIIVAVIAASLAVDLGQTAQERRRNQKVADLAALDAARGTSATYQSLARTSATRNAFPNDPTHIVTAIEGTKVNGSCVASVGVGKVCVTVTSPVDYAFRSGGPTVKAVAQAGIIKNAGFTLGTSLATANLDTEVPLLNNIVGKLLGASGTLSLVSYQGLANANINVRQLQTALGFGTVNELLTSNVTLGQLLTATALVLNNQGTAAALDARSKVLSLQSAVTNTTQIKLGDYLKVASGYDDKAADADLNVLQMITAAAELANKNNFIDVGTVLTTANPLVPAQNLTTKLGLKVIEGPKHYIGPVGGSVSTGQVELTITPTIDVNTSTALLALNVLGIPVQVGTSPIRITGDVPVKFTAAGATGTLADVRCSGSTGITVSVQRKAITTSIAANLDIYSQSALIQAANVRATVHLNNVTATAGAPGSPDSLSFAYPTEFTPSYAGKTTPGAPANVSLTTSGAGANTTATVGVLGLNITVLQFLSLDGILTSVVSPIISPVISSVLTKVATPALKALGLAIGPADVTAPLSDFDSIACGQPGLQA